MQRLDVDVVALQEVRRASNPTQRRRWGVAVPVLEAAAAGLEPGELGGLIGWRCLCCCSVSPLGTRSVSGPLCELTRRVGEQVKLTYASEEDKYTRQQTGQVPSGPRIPRNSAFLAAGKVLAPRARRVSRYVLYVHVHVLRSLRPLHRVSQLEAL
jgi:hypothetical protein